MVNKETAIQTKNHALDAITELSAILFEIREHCSEEDYEIIKRGVGLSIGKIQMELLEYIYKQYPDLDHLKD